MPTMLDLDDDLIFTALNYCAAHVFMCWWLDVPPGEVRVYGDGRVQVEDWDRDLAPPPVLHRVVIRCAAMAVNEPFVPHTLAQVDGQDGEELRQWLSLDFCQDYGKHLRAYLDPDVALSDEGLFVRQMALAAGLTFGGAPPSPQQLYAYFLMETRARLEDHWHVIEDLRGYLAEHHQMTEEDADHWLNAWASGSRKARYGGLYQVTTPDDFDTAY